MASAIQKITFSVSRDIPFNKLVLSQANVRRVKAGVSIEELAEDIARRTLLQGLNVRAVLGAEGAETGMFEVPAGGRRYRALERLVKQKRLAKTAPVPCIVREGGNPIGRNCPFATPSVGDRNAQTPLKKPSSIPSDGEARCVLEKGWKGCLGGAWAAIPGGMRPAFREAC
jgi:hypothetical protein